MKDSISQMIRQLLEEFQDVPFPNDSDDEDLSQIHAELAEYDSYVAGEIMKATGRGKSAFDLIESDDYIRSKLKRILAEDCERTKEDATNYLVYLNKLRETINRIKDMQS